MRFANLYNDSREAVERALIAMWCGESGNESQLQYSKKISEEIRHIFAPDDAMPVVQCMNSYKAVHTVSADTAKALVGGLWKKHEVPAIRAPVSELEIPVAGKDGRRQAHVSLRHHGYRFRKDRVLHDAACERPH